MNALEWNEAIAAYFFNEDAAGRRVYLTVDAEELRRIAEPENKAWLEVVLVAADLVCWSKLICFADDDAVAHCEVDAFRYAILHMAAKVSRSARQVQLHLDRTWAWAKALARAFCRLRAAFLT